MSGVDIYCAQFDKNLQGTLRQLRELILGAAPGITEHLKYQIPFYHAKGPLCYFSVNKVGNVVLGFVHGKAMLDTVEGLEGNQKQVRHLVIHGLKDLEDKSVKYAIQEAFRLNQGALFWSDPKLGK